VSQRAAAAAHSTPLRVKADGQASGDLLDSSPTPFRRWISGVPPMEMIRPVLASTRRSCPLVPHEAIAAGPPWLCQSH
jgi:hypothetical protein